MAVIEGFTQNDYTMFAASSVFEGLSEKDIDSILRRTQAFCQNYERSEIIRYQGDELYEFPVVIEGLVQATLTEGGRSQIVNQFSVGQSFAEAALYSTNVSPVEIVAIQPSRILFIPAEKLRNLRGAAAKRVLDNLVHAMSLKVGNLRTKLSVMASPRLSDRVLTYLDTLPPNEDGSITLPFKYRELAEYLGVNKTSLSRIIHTMEQDGMLRVEGRTIWVVDYDTLAEAHELH